MLFFADKKQHKYMLRQLFNLAIITAATLLFATSASAQSQSDEGVQVVEHTIEKGQFLNQIVKKYNTTTAKILELNPGLNPDKIQAGQKIKVPVRGGVGAASSSVAERSTTESEVSGSSERSEEVKRDYIEHTVASGEKFSLIVVKYRTTTVRILKLNPGLNPAKLYVGQKIKIPSANAKPQTTTAEKKPEAEKRPETKSVEESKAPAVEESKRVEEPTKAPATAVANEPKEEKVAEKAETTTVAKAESATETNAEQPSASEPIYHVVASGDTMTQIARTYQTKIADIVNLNPGLNPDRINIGQKIRVK